MSKMYLTSSRHGKRKRRRLKSIESYEIALVGAGGNGKNRWVVLKENGMEFELDLDKLQAAYKQLGTTITVCKAGELSADAAERVVVDLTGVLTSLGDMLPVEEPANPGDAEKVLAEVQKAVEALDDGSNLNNQDHFEAVQTGLTRLQDLLSNMREKTAPKDPPAAAAPEGDPAPQADPAPEPTSEGDPKPAGDPEPEPAGDPAPTATPDPKPTPADAPTPDPALGGESSEESFKKVQESLAKEIKAGLELVSKSLTDAVKTALGEVTNVMKAQNLVPGAPVPSASGVLQSGKPSRSKEDDEKAWGNWMNLNDASVDEE